MQNFTHGSARSKKIIVTGVTGQDGSHMVDFLLKNVDCKVYGGIRRISVPNHKNIEHLEGNIDFELIKIDLTDPYSIRNAIIDIEPDYFINFGAQSFVQSSWDYPQQTFEADATALIHILESLRKFAPRCHFYNAGSSEEFGDVIRSPQDEDHPLRPQSPYGAAKCAARHLVRVYRESYDMYAIQGWLFNHEGTRRGLEFVTRKISSNIARIKKSIEKEEDFEPLKLGNLEAMRDWTDAEDFMSGVWLMLNQKKLKPKEYVLASGEMHSVREFVEECLHVAGIKFSKTGEGEDEKYLTQDGKVLCKIDRKYYRYAEVNELLGDSKKAEAELGWVRKTDFKGLVRKMYENDYDE